MTELEPGQVIGYLADLDEVAYGEVIKEARKIRYSRVEERARQEEREEFAALNQLLAGLERPMELLGLRRGHKDRTNEYVCALWPRGRRLHLLTLNRLGLWSACGRTNPPGLQDLGRVERATGFRIYDVCRICLEGSRDGPYSPYLHLDALTATGLEWRS